VSKAEVELQKKAKQILDKYLVWDVQGFCEGLEKEILSLAKEGEGQIAEERKWAKHWAHEATVLKRQIADLTKERDGLSLEVEALKTEKKDWENIAEHRWDAIQELEGRLAETKKHIEDFPFQDDFIPTDNLAPECKECVGDALEWKFWWGLANK